MTERAEYIASLLRKQLEGALDAQQSLDLQAWAAERDSHAKLLREVEADGFLWEKFQAYEEIDVPDPRELPQLRKVMEPEQPRVRDIRRWLPYVAAAVFMVLGLGIYFYVAEHSNLKSTIVDRKSNDIGPGGNRATLTLADGRKISLDDAANGQLAEESGIMISKTADGQIVYEAERLETNDQSRTASTYNVIETPRGGTYQVILPDGTQAWLNAASTLKYPSRFEGGERLVEMAGEVYFSVAHDKTRPFKVRSLGQEVEVLGTAFNIAAYSDEPAVKTTLVNGSVKVSQRTTRNLPVGERGAQLKPGYQSVFRDGNIRVQQVDVSDYVAWKEGIIVLNQDDLPTVIRQIERWYDVHFDMPPVNTKNHFIGEIRRDLSLSSILDALQGYYGLKFKVEGRRIIASKQ